MLNDNPCRWCVPPKRNSTCHADCEEFIKWREELDELNAKIREQKRIDSLIVDDIIKFTRKKR